MRAQIGELCRACQDSANGAAPANIRTGQRDLHRNRKRDRIRKVAKRHRKSVTHVLNFVPAMRGDCVTDKMVVGFECVPRGGAVPLPGACRTLDISEYQRDGFACWRLVYGGCSRGAQAADGTVACPPFCRRVRT